MASFDINAARAAGYSDAEIQQYLLNQPGTADARGAGYSDQEILQHFGMGQSTAAPITNIPAASASSATPMSPFLRVPLGLGSAALRGALALPSFVGQSIGANPFGPEGEIPPTATPTPPESLLQLTHNVGLTDNPALAPQSSFEKYGQAAAEGLGSALPALAIGAPAIPALLSGVAGGMVGDAVSSVTGSPLAGAAAGTVAGLGTGIGSAALASNRAANLISNLGSSSTLEQAGDALQDAARGWLTNTLPAKLEAAKEPLNMIMGTSTLPTSLNNLRSVVGGITESGGALDDAVKLFRPQLPDKLQKILDQVTNPPLTPAEYGVPRIPPSPPSWQDVDRLQTEIGRAMSNSRMVADTGQENLSNMYRAISDDKRAALAATGNPDALSAFDNWNTEASRLLDFKEGTLSKVVAGPKPSGDDPNPERVASRLLSGAKLGGSDIEALRGEIPSAIDELASAHFKTGGAWSKLSPEGQVALVPDPASRDIISNYTANQGKPGGLVSGLHTTAGNLMGGALGIIASHMLNFPGSDLLHEAIGATAGGLAPTITRHLASGLGNPLLPATGGLAGYNASQPPLGFRVAQ